MTEGIEQNGQSEVQMSSAMADTLSALEGLGGSSDIIQSIGKEAVEKGVIKVVNNSASPQQEEPNNEPENSGNDNQAETKPVVAEKKKEEAVSEKIEEEPELTEEEESNPLLKAIKGKKSKNNEISFENFDQIKAYAKKSLGIEVKTENDFNKVFNSALEWRKSAQKAEELEETVSKFESIFNDMPKQLLDATKAYFSGESNWESHITSRPKFDFSKSVENQDIKQLVQYYYPNKFTDEDWAAQDRPMALDIAIQASKDRFVQNKRDIDEESARITKKSEEQRDRMKSSINSSLSSLKESFPDMDPTGLKKISSVLESGDINSLFIDKNGAYRKDAAEKLMMALYGKDTIKSMMKVSARKAETATNEEILSRGADKPRPQKGGAQHEKVDEIVMKEIESMVGGLNKKRTY